MNNASSGLRGRHPSPTSFLDRRGFLIGAGAAGVALGTAIGEAYTQIAAADYTLRIAPLQLELAHGKVIDTFAYNGMVPGPVLRLREGRPVNIDIRNDTDVDDIIHWHGLFVPSAADGEMEKDRRWCRAGVAPVVTCSRQNPAAPGGITATTWPEEI